MKQMMPDQSWPDSESDPDSDSVRFQVMAHGRDSFPGSARPRPGPQSAISSLNEGLIYDLLCFRFVFFWPMLKIIGNKAKVWIIVGW